MLSHIIMEVRVMRNPQRWLIALMVVLALHGVVLGGLLMQRSANTTPTSNSIAVQTQVAAAGSSGAAGGPMTTSGNSGVGAQGNAASGHDVPQPNHSAPADSPVPKPEPKPAAPTESTASMSVNNAANHLGNPSNGLSQGSSANPSGTPSSAAVGSGAASSGAGGVQGNGNGDHGSVANGSNGASMSVDCAATVKPANANAASGLDVTVWVERTASGAQFVSLVNQAGEGSRYLREIRAAVADVRFVSHEARCTGQRVKVRVRITS